MNTDFWICSSPSIVSLLETLRPLQNLRDELPAESFSEAHLCLKLFDDVHRKIGLVSSKLKDYTISFDLLAYFHKENCFQDLIRIIEIVGVDEKVITGDHIQAIYEKFIKVRTEITEILLPSYFIRTKSYW